MDPGEGDLSRVSGGGDSAGEDSPPWSASGDDERRRDADLEPVCARTAVPGEGDLLRPEGERVGERGSGSPWRRGMGELCAGGTPRDADGDELRDAIFPLRTPRY